MTEICYTTAKGSYGFAIPLETRIFCEAVTASRKPRAASCLAWLAGRYPTDVLLLSPLRIPESGPQLQL